MINTVNFLIARKFKFVRENVEWRGIFKQNYMKHDSITNSETIILNFGLGIRTHGISGVISVEFSLDSEMLTKF